MVFGLLGPIIRRKCPEGFVLTEWTRQRYGIIAASYLSLLTYASSAYFDPILISCQPDYLVSLHGS